jgi:hypothetical protein
MHEHAAERGQESPAAGSAGPRSRELTSPSDELADYFPDHLIDFYELLKADYEDMRRANRIIFYETRVIVWLCVLLAIVIAFKASPLGGSLVSLTSLAVGFISKFIKVKTGEREDLEKRLEALRLTTLEIEHICLSLHLARTVGDQQQRAEVLAQLERMEGAERAFPPQKPPRQSLALPDLQPPARRARDVTQLPHRKRTS